RPGEGPRPTPAVGVDGAGERVAPLPELSREVHSPDATPYFGPLREQAREEITEPERLAEDLQAHRRHAVVPVSRADQRNPGGTRFRAADPERAEHVLRQGRV